MLRMVIVVAGLLAGLAAAQAGEPFIVLQSTTSTQNSGLLDYLLAKFTAETGIAVHVVAVGTGQALKNARNGDGDVVLVHAPAAEKAFVASGHGLARHKVMYNDFVIVGPKADPAGVGDEKDVAKALAKIAAARAVFVSRGDDSGTHKKERRLWRQAGVDVAAASGGWYRETGSGMGATLNVAAGMNAYALSDRATWLTFANKGDLTVLVEGDKRLFNQYGVIIVNPARHRHVKAEQARRLVDWLLSAQGQAAIAAYRVKGRQLFFPNAGSG